MELSISQPKVVRLPRNEKQTYRLNSRPQMWPMVWIYQIVTGVTSVVGVPSTHLVGSDNGLLPGRCQAIIWTSAGILLIRTLGTSFNEIVSEIHTLSSRKCTWKWHLQNGGNFVSTSIHVYVNGPLRGESTGDRWIHHTKGPVMRTASPCPDAHHDTMSWPLASVIRHKVLATRRASSYRQRKDLSSANYNTNGPTGDPPRAAAQD